MTSRALALLVLLSPVLAAAEGRPAAPPATGKAHGGFFADCGRCHTTAGWRRIRSGVQAIDHARTGFRLVGKHATLDCVACHRPERDLKHPWPGACAACHEDTQHRGALGRDCARCHSDRDWRVPRAYDIHARTLFPLTGAHLVADCASCHLRADQGVYNDTPVACIACHDAAYRRTDIHPNHVAANFSTDCAQCHRTSSFYPARFRHATFFPLTGGHAGLECGACHADSRYGGTPTSCDACHLKQYQATTNPNHAASRFSRDCAACHSTAAWRPAKAAWHDSFFPITSGKHRGIDCAQCHPSTGDYRQFSCTGCHTRAATDPEHSRVSGYSYDDRSCLNCHERGD